MSDIEYAKNYETRLLCCALHDPGLLAKLMQTTMPADWTLPAARFVWLCMLDLIAAYGKHPTFEKLVGYVELWCTSAKPAGGYKLVLPPSEFKSLADVLESMEKTTAAEAYADSASLTGSLQNHLAHARCAAAADALQQTAQAATQGGVPLKERAAGQVVGNGAPTTAGVSEVAPTPSSPIVGRRLCGVYVTKGGLYLACVRIKSAECRSTEMIDGSMRKIPVGWYSVNQSYKRNVSATAVRLALQRYFREFTPDRKVVAHTTERDDCFGSSSRRSGEMDDLVQTVFAALGTDWIIYPGLDLERRCRSVANKGLTPKPYLKPMVIALSALWMGDGAWAREVANNNGRGSATEEESKHQPRVRPLWID